MKNSGLGIASFISSIVTGILIFLLFIFAGVMETSTPGGGDEDATEPDADAGEPSDAS